MVNFILEFLNAFIHFLLSAVEAVEKSAIRRVGEVLVVS